MCINRYRWFRCFNFFIIVLGRVRFPAGLVVRCRSCALCAICFPEALSSLSISQCPSILATPRVVLVGAVVSLTVVVGLGLTSFPDIWFLCRPSANQTPPPFAPHVCPPSVRVVIDVTADVLRRSVRELPAGLENVRTKRRSLTSPPLPVAGAETRLRSLTSRLFSESRGPRCSPHSWAV